LEAKQTDYKALGSLPGEHETLIPFKQLVSKFFFVAEQRGEKAKATKINPLGWEEGVVLGGGVISTPQSAFHSESVLCGVVYQKTPKP
jgi:hypothetical protein